MMRRGTVRRTARRTSRRVLRRRVLVGGAVLFMVGGVAHKLSQQDVQKVEQQAGKPVEQMSEQELQGALARAGVQEQPVSAQDERAVQGAGVAEEEVVVP